MFHKAAGCFFALVGDDGMTATAAPHADQLPTARGAEGYDQGMVVENVGMDLGLGCQRLTCARHTTLLAA